VEIIRIIVLTESFIPFVLRLKGLIDGGGGGSFVSVVGGVGQAALTALDDNINRHRLLSAVAYLGRPTTRCCGPQPHR